MNLSTMSLPQSSFIQALMCVRAFLSEENGEFGGFRNPISKRGEVKKKGSDRSGTDVEKRGIEGQSAERLVRHCFE